MWRSSNWLSSASAGEFGIDISSVRDSQIQLYHHSAPVDGLRGGIVNLRAMVLVD